MTKVEIIPQPTIRAEQHPLEKKVGGGKGGYSARPITRRPFLALPLTALSANLSGLLDAGRMGRLQHRTGAAWDSIYRASDHAS